MQQQGPSGGNGGQAFSDNPPNSQIRQVVVHHGAYINKIEIHYDDGTVFTHGNKDAPSVDVFAINPGDYLKGISGQTGNLHDDGGPYVATISFVSSAGVQSPIWGGVAPGQGGGILGGILQPGNYFDNLAAYSYTAPPGEPIIGFWGKSGDYIDQIGVYTG